MRELSLQALHLIADRFRVLSEPVRLQIIHALSEGEMSVTELVAKLGTSQPNVSKHLALLQQSGILCRDKRGNSVYYSISDESTFRLCELVCDSLGERLAEQAAILRSNGVKSYE